MFSLSGSFLSSGRCRIALLPRLPHDRLFRAPYWPILVLPLLILSAPSSSSASDWTVVMSRSPSPAEQIFLTLPSVEEEALRSLWDRGYAVTGLAYADKQWRIVGTKREKRGVQAVRVTETFPKEAIQELWDQKYSIEHIGFGNGRWVLVMGTGTGWTGQSYQMSGAFPEAEIRNKLREGSSVTLLSFVPESSGDLWIAVFSQGTSYGSQHVIRLTDLNDGSLEPHFANRYALTQLAFGEGQWAAVMSQGTGILNQTWMTESGFPEPKIRNLQDEGYGLTSLLAAEQSPIPLAKNIRFFGARESLGTAVNSSAEELTPIISPDGKTLYFSRKNHPANVGGILPDGNDDAWVSYLQEDGTWSAAVNMGPAVNSSKNEWVCSVTPDGNTLLMTTYLRHRTMEGWSEKDFLKIEKFYNKNKFAGFYLGNDGMTLLLSVQRDDTVGDQDLYVCFRQSDGSFSEPLNLGSTVNTKSSDFNPFLAADGRTLYFASYGHPGFGNADIFVVRRLDDSWIRWTTPLNLGPAVNSDDWEGSFTIPASGDYAYVISSKDSLGGSDIFRIPLTNAAKPEPVVIVTGRVFNAKTKDAPRPETVAARISYQQLPEGKESGIASSDPRTGEYKIVLPAGRVYAFRAEAEGFIGVNESLDTTGVSAYREIQRDLYLVPVEIGQTIRLNNVFFDFNKAELKADSFPELDRIADFLLANATLSIEVSGHTDEIGTAEYNSTLSTNRARAVANYLAAKGVPASRLAVHGYGKDRPIASNETEEGRQLNRRVEFTILKR